MSTEQDRLLDHPIDANGRVLAGPGTGKSTTVLRLVARLSEGYPDRKVKVITFTRAATAELVEKIREDGYGLIEPTTLHSFALSVLMGNPGMTNLPEPLRVPDKWETKNLLEPDLSVRLKAARHSEATPTLVAKLTNEMAAGWDRLDPGHILLSDVDPALRNAYRAAWMAQRTVFGYSLFAEMPFTARELIQDHPSLYMGDVKFLVVDEYQDLNRCDIGLVEAVAETGVTVLAVGDDDQSIYSFRGAAPHGIRQFCEPAMYPALADNSRDYTLSTSFRCGEAILSAARDLIESSPGRPTRPSLRPGPDNPPGVLRYLRFADQTAERLGVVRLINYLVSVEGVPPDQIVVLLRGDSRQTWSKPLRDLLQAAGLPATDVEGAMQPLFSNDARHLLALARIVDNVEDDLAWWTLLKLERGIGDSFVRAVSDSALNSGERFNSRLLRLYSAPLDAASGASIVSQNRSRLMIERILGMREAAASIVPPDADSPDGWTQWLLNLAVLAEIQVDEELRTLLVSTGSTIPAADGLRHYLDALEPAARDVALQTEGISIMSMMRSKGLTRRAAIVMGVEAGVVPSPRAEDQEEERRLLYVAMTRARHYLYLTMANTRTDNTAFAGGGSAGSSRGRCTFFSGSRLNLEPGTAYLASIHA